MQLRIIEVMKRHRGKANAITVKELSQEVGIRETEPSSRRTREIISEIVQEGIAPIASCKYGYFMVGADSELHDYMESLGNRIDSIKDRRNGIFKAYRNGCVA